ncbi:hypothetical protein G6F43_000399 [Rhizopus delemar]|nr:hypothetical protein G6F43_000399 [Rhizopus delemar]
MSDNKLVIAYHPYEAQREDEISFEKDETIQVVDDSDPDWWVGKKKDGSSGYFPSNFVGIKEDEKKEVEKEEEKEEEKEQEENLKEKVEDNEQETEEEPTKVDQVLGMARVMEDYAMQESGEISLHRGGIVNVYEIIDDDWARGELNGKVGKYPMKYVEDIDMPGRPDLGRQEKPQGTGNEDEHSSATKGGFKLAAFGVKQGGIGSLLAGGFPGLKKTPTKHEEPAEEEAKPATKVLEEPKLASPPIPKVPEQPKLASPTISKVSEEPKLPTSSAHEASEEKPVAETLKSFGKAIVLHPYDADNEDELNLLRGEYVEILDRDVDEGWWKGTNERGETGVFPSSFVKELEEDIVAPPTPVRSARPPVTSTSSLAKPPATRPVSLQPDISTRPISVQSPAPRPSTVQVLSNAPVAIPPKPPVTPQREIEDQGTDKLQTETKEPSASDKVTETTAEESIPEIDTPKSQVSTETESLVPAAEVPSPVEETKSVDPVRQDSISSHASSTEQQPINENVPSTVAESTENKSINEKENHAKAMPAETAPVESPSTEISEVVPAVTEAEDVKEVEKMDTESSIQEVSNVEENKKDTEKEKEEVKKDAGEQKSEEPSNPVSEEVSEEVQEEEKKQEIDILPSGPKLTAPSRARIGVSRRPPQVKKSEPSQTEILQKEVCEAPEEEKKPVKAAPSPPAKPVKPIFAKFPTPFAVGAGEISKKVLKPTQTRKPWEEEEKSGETEETEAPRPVGVRNIASRFNVSSNNGGNEVLETKLKNHTKNEVEKIRKEFQQLLQEEQEKRSQLEGLVQDLLERVKQLESKE